MPPGARQLARGFLLSPISLPISVCSASSWASPFMHILTSRADRKQEIKKQNKIRKWARQIHKKDPAVEDTPPKTWNNLRKTRSGVGWMDTGYSWWQNTFQKLSRDLKSSSHITRYYKSCRWQSSLAAFGIKIIRFLSSAGYSILPRGSWANRKLKSNNK